MKNAFATEPKRFRNPKLKNETCYCVRLAKTNGTNAREKKGRRKRESS
jgi:hypothetical protein